MSDHPVVPRSDGEREREIRERSPRLSVADAGKHYHADVEFLCALLSDLREQVGRAQEALEKIAKAEGRFSMNPQAWAENTIEDMATLAEEALAAMSAAVARETGE